jgi:hypothetical protein
MRVQRTDGGWVVVDGRGAAAGEWRLAGDRVLLRSSSGRKYEVPQDEVPLEIAVALVALREAAAFVMRHPGVALAGPAALDHWLAASREALLRGNRDARDVLVGWPTFRSIFETVVAAASRPSAGTALRAEA